MCGNGVRCVAVHEWLAQRVALGETISIATDAGIRTATICSRQGTDGAVVEVDMGVIRVDTKTISLDPDLPATAVDVGNPHAVIFQPVAAEKMAEVVRAAERRRDVWPAGVNVEFAAVAPDDDGARVRVHERGVGWTEACGTGACAVAAAMVQSSGLDSGERWIELDGGRLDVSIERGPPGRFLARMRGPARRVFSGEVAT
jgi:diaminopimelate epimerase